MLQKYRILFSTLIVFLTTTLLSNSSHHFFRHKYLIDTPNFKLSYYGIITGLALLLSSPFIISCQLSLMKIGYLIILFIISTYFFCEPCRKGGYHMVATYYLLLPFATLIFDCPQLQAFTLFLTVALSFGRLGCLFAGCCHGDRIPDDEVEKTSLCMLYPDPQQQINQNYQVQQCYAQPTIILETIMQCVLTLACLMFPQRANFIYGLGSIFVILFSKKRSKDSARGETIQQALVGCLLYLSVCFMKDYMTGTGMCFSSPNLNNITTKEFIPYILGALIMSYSFSNDVEFKKLSIVPVIMMGSYLFSQKI